VKILVATYTVLAIAAGARAAVQLATRAGEAPVQYGLSAAAAAVYLVLAIALRRPERWRTVAIVAASVELVGVLAVGIAERLSPNAWPDETVWSGFGAGYGWAPLVLPVVALFVLGGHVLSLGRGAPRARERAGRAGRSA
jgi:hypothetical protein